MKRARETTAVVLVVGWMLVSCSLFSTRNREPEPPATLPNTGEGVMKATRPAVMEQKAVATRTAVPVLPPADSANQPLKLENFNATPPEDLIKEMFYFTSGAGDPEGCQLFPARDAAVELIEPEKLILNFCWQWPDEQVTLTITWPNQKKENLVLDTTPGENKKVNGLYPFDLDHPAGKYRFQVASSSGSGEFWVDARKDVGPVLYEVIPASGKDSYHVNGPHHRLHLAGFSAGEEVKLFVYLATDTLKFVGWQAFKTGEDGQAWLDATFPVNPKDELALIAVGTISGEVHLTGVQIATWPEFRAFCPGVPPTRMHLDGFARATRDIALYEKLNGNRVGTLAAGTVVQIHQGPYCKDKALWWLVAVPFDAGPYGYGAESVGQEYQLEPVQ